MCSLALQVKSHSPIVKALFNFWTLFDFFLLFWSCATFFFWSQYVLLAGTVRFDVTNETFTDYFNILTEQDNSVSFWAVWFLLACMKILYFSEIISEKMMAFLQTLQSAFWDMVYYLVLTCLILVGFSLWGIYLYGPYMHRFKTIAESFFQVQHDEETIEGQDAPTHQHANTPTRQHVSCVHLHVLAKLSLIFGVPLLFFTPSHLSTQLVRFVLGDFDYDALDLYQPDNTSIYFLAYQFLVYIIIVNLFVAIVLNHFIFIHQNMDNPEHSWRNDTPSGVFKLFQRMWGKLYPCIKCFLFCISDEKKATWDSELVDLKRQWHFEKWMSKAVWAAYARQGNSVDLMKRFQLAYMKDLDLTGRDLYVNARTLREWMGQDSVAKETPEDIAYQLIEAYLSIKVTIGLRPKKLLTGERYLPRSALSNLHYFEVLKYNRWGIASKRLLVVDSTTSTLFVYGETTFQIDTATLCNVVLNTSAGWFAANESSGACVESLAFVFSYTPYTNWYTYVYMGFLFCSGVVSSTLLDCRNKIDINNITHIHK